MAADSWGLPSCKTDVICDLKSATQIFANIPFRYGEGGFFLSILEGVVFVTLLSGIAAGERSAGGFNDGLGKEVRVHGGAVVGFYAIQIYSRTCTRRITKFTNLERKTCDAKLGSKPSFVMQRPHLYVCGKFTVDRFERKAIRFVLPDVKAPLKRGVRYGAGLEVDVRDRDADPGDLLLKIPGALDEPGVSRSGIIVRVDSGNGARIGGPVGGGLVVKILEK